MKNLFLACSLLLFSSLSAHAQVCTGATIGGGGGDWVGGGEPSLIAGGETIQGNQLTTRGAMSINTVQTTPSWSTAKIFWVMTPMSGGTCYEGPQGNDYLLGMKYYPFTPGASTVFNETFDLDQAGTTSAPGYTGDYTFGPEALAPNLGEIPVDTYCLFAVAFTGWDIPGGPAGGNTMGGGADACLCQSNITVLADAQGHRAYLKTACSNGVPAGISSVEASSSLKFYPNPVQNLTPMTVELPKAVSGQADVSFVSLSGQVVFKSRAALKNAKISVIPQNLSPEVYTLQVKTSGKIFASKVTVTP